MHLLWWLAFVAAAPPPATIWDDGRFVTDRYTSVHTADLFLRGGEPWVRVSDQASVPWPQFAAAVYDGCSGPGLLSVRVRPGRRRGWYMETVTLVDTATVPGTVNAHWPDGFVVNRWTDFELGQPRRHIPYEVEVLCELGLEYMRRSEKPKVTSTYSTSWSIWDVPHDSEESETPTGPCSTTACSVP